MEENLFGASLSVKQCRNFGINDLEVLKAAITELHIKRFRLMSYWNEIEKSPGKYDFKYLDRQIRTVESYGGEVTLCLGVRQPRWPESHWPNWTEKVSQAKRNRDLIKFIKLTVNRYKDSSTISSWQLENEALLKSFGEKGDFNRKRLIQEYELVKKLDPTRPLIMSTSTSWGIPLRNPIPDTVGFSYYRITHDNNEYRHSIYMPWVFSLRAFLINFIWRRPSFIHELQAEPWGPMNIWEMDAQEQAKSMNEDILASNIKAAIKTKLFPIDFWGLEWWYWLKQNNDNDIWNKVKELTK